MKALSITIHQCLFGYQDGHRLLASSMKLGDQGSLLTQLSDLAPGTLFGESDGYWTGLPIPKLNRYALLRTWPAPEMPRPGCVWTHALLINPLELGEIEDLSVLRMFARRPQGRSDEAAYREPLEVELPTSSIDRQRIAETDVRSLIDALYGGTGNLIRAAQPGLVDDALFAVWSQQWPKLRRNFRFQTAASRDPQSVVGSRFDIVVALSTERDPVPADHSRSWLVAAAEDIIGHADAGLRPFLWRYGDDVRRQRGSFRPLTELKLLDSKARDADWEQVGSLLNMSFPEQDDAIQLKQDISDGRVIPSVQLDVLEEVLNGEGPFAMPAPTSEGIDRLAKLWPTHSRKLLHIAEQTIGSAKEQDSVASQVFDTVTSAIPLTDFWKLTAPYPGVRKRMVAQRPDLLLAPEALELDNNDLVNFLPHLPDHPDIARALLPRLIERNDARLSNLVIELFPQDVAIEVVKAVNADKSVGRSWIAILVTRPDVTLQRAVLRHVTRTSVLYDLASAFGWLTSDTIRAGIDPWIAGLEKITSDLSGEKRDILQSFMVALALAAPSDGARRMLEQFFSYVHSMAMTSKLPWRARDILSPVVPDSGWGWGHDFAWRIRHAVARTYVNNQYPPSSFALLSKDKKVRGLLSDAADSLSGGKPYSRAVRSK